MTTQRPDWLRHEGADYPIKPFPLEALGGHWASLDRGDGHFVTRFGSLSSGCWRGYVARWEIVNDRLYLVGFETLDQEGHPLTIQDIFETDRLFAFWFTGEVSSAFGDHVFGKYEPTTRFDHVWKFRFGVLESRTPRNNDTPELRARERNLRSFSDNL
jgi:hypothetical protein